MLINPFKLLQTILCLSLFCLLVLNAQAQTSFETTTLRCELDETGRLTALIDRRSGINYVPDGHAGYLIRLKMINKQELSPQRMQRKGDQIWFTFANGLKLELRVNAQPEYLSFQLLSCSDTRQINTLLWGPLNTAIRDTIGEVVGVVRNPNFAIGIQALNAKTMGENKKMRTVLLQVLRALLDPPPLQKYMGLHYKRFALMRLCHGRLMCCI